ncbi:MAG: hypothetical protein WC753_03985 [Candidatus Gracilibacteria bacterium]
MSDLESSTSQKNTDEVVQDRLSELDKIKFYDQVVDFTGLSEKITGKQLYHVVEEIFSVESQIIDQKLGKGEVEGVDNAEKKKVIEDARNRLLETQRLKTLWNSVMNTCSGLETLQGYQDRITVDDPHNTIRNLVLGILWQGYEKIAVAQSIDSLAASRLPQTTALIATISSEILQEYAEEYFEKGRFQVVKKLFEVPELAGKKAVELVEKAKPSLREYWKGMEPAKQEKTFARMVKFLSEDNVGQKIVAMTETIPGSSIGREVLKSGKSTLSGVKEGLFSPLCACMMAVMLDGAPDKEQALIQYITFLVAGQVAQEGVKGVLTIIDKVIHLAPKESPYRNSLAALKKKLNKKIAGGKISGHLMLGISIMAVMGLFSWKPAQEFIGNIAQGIDENWDQGQWREATLGGISGLSYMMQFTSKRFLPVAIGMEVGKIALDGANPFTEQDDFLLKFVTGDGDNLKQVGEQVVQRDPIDAWNARVDGAKGNILKENELQQKIIDYYKLENKQDWALRSIVPFTSELTQLDVLHAQLCGTLTQLTIDPHSQTTLAQRAEIEKLRYREYALAGEDVWYKRGDIGPSISSMVADNVTLLSPVNKAIKKLTGTDPLKPIRGYVGLGEMGDIAGRNDKALKRLDDLGGVEDRLDEFFEHAEARIKEETEKCMKRTEVSPGYAPMGGVYVPARYEYTRDEQKYAQIKSWVDQIQAAKKQWEAMRSTADVLAKRVVIARGLGVYDQKKWTSPDNNPFREGAGVGNDNFAFQGMMGEVQRRAEIIALTIPTDAKSAFDIGESVGWERKGYGTDNVPFTSARAKIDEEYKKYNSWKNFGPDNRRIDYAALQSMVQTAYSFGLDPKLLEKVMDPITNIARNQHTGNYVTPEIANDVTDNLGRLLLDQTCEEQGKSGIVLTPEKPEITFNKNGDYGKRIFSIEYDQDLGDVIVEQEEFGISHELGFTTRTPTTKKFPRKTPIDQYNPKIRNTLLKPMIQKYLVDQAKERAESDAKAKITAEKESNKANDETAFQKYYELPDIEEPGFGKWEKVTSDGIVPITYVSRCYRKESVRNPSVKNVWGWMGPQLDKQIKVATYWGPGDVAEYHLKNLKDFRYAGWTKKAQEAIKNALISGDSEKALERILGLTEHHSIIETHIIGADTNRDLSKELLERLKPYLHTSTDKKAFLTKTLDVLIEYGGIANGEVDDIVKKIL